jgi:hypothetical protein
LILRKREEIERVEELKEVMVPGGKPAQPSDDLDDEDLEEE